MMDITSQIFKNLKEAEGVKKPYGDKPEEGRKLNLKNKKKVSVPKGKGLEKYKARKFQQVGNKQAAEIYPSDTDKLYDNIDKTNHNDKGEIAKQNTKKASRTVNKPFGDKIQQSTSKLIKESIEKKTLKEVDISDYAWIVEQVEGAMNPVFNAIDSKFGTEMGYDSDFCTSLCEDIEEQLEEWIDDNSESEEDEDDEDYDESAKPKALKEDGSYSYGAGLLREIYNQYVSLGMEDEFFEDCYNRMDISPTELQTWFEMGESAKPTK